MSIRTHNRSKVMSPKKPWITQLRPNEKRKQAQSGKESQQEQQGQQQDTEYGEGSTE
jgi:hypothetical protein